jgi:hypothetical protein
MEDVIYDVRDVCIIYSILHCTIFTNSYLDTISSNFEKICGMCYCFHLLHFSSLDVNFAWSLHAYYIQLIILFYLRILRSPPNEA